MPAQYVLRRWSTSWLWARAWPARRRPGSWRGEAGRWWCSTASSAVTPGGRRTAPSASCGSATRPWSTWSSAWRRCRGGGSSRPTPARRSCTSRGRSMPGTTTSWPPSRPPTGPAACPSSGWGPKRPPSAGPASGSRARCSTSPTVAGCGPTSPSTPSSTVRPRRGAVLRFESPVVALERTGDGLRVVTDDGSVVAPVVVVAAGAWAPDLLTGLLPLPALTVTEELVAYFRRREPDRPWPCFIHRSRPAALRPPRTAPAHQGRRAPDRSGRPPRRAHLRAPARGLAAAAGRRRALVARVWTPSRWTL